MAVENLLLGRPEPNLTLKRRRVAMTGWGINQSLPYTFLAALNQLEQR